MAMNGLEKGSAIPEYVFLGTETLWPGSPCECGLGGSLERLAYGWHRWGALLGWESHLAHCLAELVGQEAGLGWSCGKLLLGVRPIL